MKWNRARRICCTAALLPLLVGCAASGPLPPATAAPSAMGAEGPLVAWAASHSVGSDTVLEDPAFGAHIAARIDGSYRSASGKLCKRVRVIPGSYQGPGEPVAICREGDTWFMAPRIWGGALTGEGR